MSFMHQVEIDEQTCTACGICYELFGCPAIGRRDDGLAYIHRDLCNGNGSCMQVCPERAIRRPKREVARK